MGVNLLVWTANPRRDQLYQKMASRKSCVKYIQSCVKC